MLDLTEANPTRVGLGGAAWASLAALSDARALDYAPDPLGLREAREAVARYHAERGDRVDPEHVVLTAGTSEAYGVGYGEGDEEVFQRVLEAAGRKVEEFDGFGPTVRTLRQFSEGCNQISSLIRDFMMPNPDL